MSAPGPIPQPKPSWWIMLVIGAWPPGCLVFDGILHVGFADFISAPFQFLLLMAVFLAAAGAAAMQRWKGRPRHWWSFAPGFVALVLLLGLSTIPLGHWWIDSIPDPKYPHSPTRFQQFDEWSSDWSPQSGYPRPDLWNDLWLEALKNVPIRWLTSLLAFVSIAWLWARTNQQRFFWLALAIGSAGIASFYLEILLDVRGAIPYIRRFHFVTPLVAAAAAATMAIAVGQVCRPGKHPAIAGSLYILVFFTVWYFAVPWGDAVGVLFQKWNVKPPDPELGYGWFYIDDSGMGNHPTRVSEILPGILYAWPWWAAILPAFVFAAFRTKSGDRRRSEPQPTNSRIG